MLKTTKPHEVQFWIECPACEGIGDIVIENPNRPEGLEMARCEHCEGRGFVQWAGDVHAQSA